MFIRGISSCLYFLPIGINLSSTDNASPTIAEILSTRTIKDLCTRTKSFLGSFSNMPYVDDISFFPGLNIHIVAPRLHEVYILHHDFFISRICFYKNGHVYRCFRPHGLHDSRIMHQLIVCRD